MKKNRKRIILVSAIVCIVLFMAIFFIHDNMSSSQKDVTNRSNFATSNSKANKDYVYLSDIDYDTAKSSAYGNILKDITSAGSKITVKVDGTAIAFDKGMWAHAESQLVYDLSEYNYDYFTAFVGINTTSSKGDGVKFSIYTSEDGENWGDAKFEGNKTPGSNSSYVKIDIKGAKYLRLFAAQNSGNAADHAVYADAKLITKEAEENEQFHQLSYYDEILKKHDVEYNYNNNYRLILERALVSKLGYWNLRFRAEGSEKDKATVDWIFGSDDRLEQIIEVGAISNPTKFFDIISNIYNERKAKLSGDNGYVYQKLMIGMAAAYSSDKGISPLSFSHISLNQNYLERFDIYVDMYENDKLWMPTKNSLTGPFTTNEWFKTYHVELMRMIMEDGTSNTDLVWLNGYSHDVKSISFWMVPYVKPVYTHARLYDDANFATYDKKYSLTKYNVPFGLIDGKKVSRYWMVKEIGAICWGQSRFGQSLSRVNGIPAAGGYQPAHEPWIQYYQYPNGDGFWTPQYGGWSSTGSKWGGGGRYRYIFDWGNKSFADQNISGSKGASSSGYLYLAQDNLNRLDLYQKSLYYNLAANSYTTDDEKLQSYFKALEANNINLDSYDYIINLYKKHSVKNEGGTITSADWKELALKIADSYTYYPVAMYDLFKVIRPYLDGVDRLEIDRLEIDRLNQATKATASNVLHYNGAKQHANWLLGRVQADPVTFSFDGANAGKLIENANYNVPWRFSLDGGKTYIAVRDGKRVTVSDENNIKDYIVDKSFTLTKEEIASITDENDIIIGFMGLPNYKFRINISKGTLDSTIYANDLENRVLGVTQVYEWRFSEEDNWTSYGDEAPDLNGDKVLYMRKGATGRNLASDSVTYTFTMDPTNTERKYIPVKHISLQAVSTEATSNGGAAINALDANYNTRWHSAWNGTDTERYITVKLDEPVYLSAVEFVPAGGGNGKIYDGTIYGSMDGQNWQVLKQMKNIKYTNSADTVAQAIANTKSFDIEDPSKVQYVKIVADRTNGNWFAARAFNFYEDTTVKAVADFSFDGANAGKITLFEENKGTNYKYSIDGGSTWKKVSEDDHQLTDDELEEINEENNVKIVIDGDNTVYSINIKKGEAPALGYLNDLENRPIGLSNISKLEWKILGDKKWTSYSEKEPNVEGNKVLLVRTKATGKYQASDSVEYQFTEDNQPADMKYISIKHETIHSYSTQSVDSGRPFYAPNIIDGKEDTIWHTDFRYDVRQQEVKPYVTIKLDESKYISALEFIQMKYKPNDPDYIKNAIVYVSDDGTNWKEAGKIENCPQDNELRKIKFSESVYGQYVKLEMETYDIFASLATVNLYEDTTKKLPIESIEYSTTGATNKDVVAKIVSDDEITVTNNGGKNVYTFTENGEFTFEYTKKGKAKTITAKVDWIDKKVPIGTIKYSTTDITNGNVVVTLDTNEPVTITNNGGKNTYTFTENGDFTFEFVDKAGNEGEATATVDLIDKNAPTASVEYSTTSPTNKDVVATIKVDNGVTIRNNKGLKEYTFTENGTFRFEFMDKAGNMGTMTAKVNNIDKVAPTAKVTYSTTKLTNKNVVATVIGESEEITITNNDESKRYTFTENGEFTFEFVDKAGNKGNVKAAVDWIGNPLPTAKVKYDKSSNKKAIVKVVEPSTEITFKEGNGVYEYTKNGTYVIHFYDKLGNMGSVTAVVDWLKEDKPDTSKKPSIINNANSNNGHTSTNSQNSTKNNNNSSNLNSNTIEYKELSSANIKVGINGLADMLSNVKSLKVDKYPLSTTLQAQVGSESEMFELNLIGIDNKSVDIKDAKITLTVDLNTSKEFESIYALKDKTLKELTYKKIGGNAIEVSTDSLGSFVVKYKSNEVENKDKEVEKKNSNSDISKQDNLPEKEDSSNNLIWYIVSVALVLAFGSAVVIYRRKRLNNHF